VCDDYVKGNYSVFVDAEELCSCQNLPLAIGLYFAAFYVLNLSFPQNSRRTLVFLQKYALQLNDTTRDKAHVRASQVCTSLMEKLQKSKHQKKKQRSRPTATAPSTVPASEDSDHSASETMPSDYSVRDFMETDNVEPSETDPDVVSETEGGNMSTAKGSSKSKLNFPQKLAEIPSKTAACKKSTVKGSSESKLQLVSKSVEISSEIAAQVQKADKDERMTCDVPGKKRKIHPHGSMTCDMLSSEPIIQKILCLFI